VRSVNNPFGQDWLNKLKAILPTIERLNISDSRLIIDGNRKALHIWGHKTKNSKSYCGMTKISCKGAELEIRTTTMFPYFFFMTIPILVIVIIWLTSKSTTFSIVSTIIFVWSPIFYVNDLLKQDKFNENVRKEIESISHILNNNSQ
jgi:hypothetical protein